VRAVVCDSYGPPEVQRITDIARPVPRDDEILVAIYATTVTRTDCHARAADPFVWRLIAGLRRPRRRVLGIEFAGRVEQAGAKVRDFEVGDDVFGITGLGFGAHAEYICVRARGPVALKPAGVPFELAAAALDGFTDARAKLRRADVRSGESVLVYGASGSIGTAAVQLAKSMGAEVTAVCSGKNVALVRWLGADEVIDYEREDFTANGRTYDVIFDAVGAESYGRCR
jgi:NADPH:quinone reductase-like Zn-dependent oxidoreductase